MPKLLAAFTPVAGYYPPYVNFSVTDEGVSITVRGPIKDDGTMGDTVQMTMTVSDYAAFLADLVGNSVTKLA